MLDQNTIHKFVISNVIDFNKPIFITHLLFTTIMYYFAGTIIIQNYDDIKQLYVFIAACCIDGIYFTLRIIQICNKIGCPFIDKPIFKFLSFVSIVSHLSIVMMTIAFFINEKTMCLFFGAIAYFGKLIMKSSYERAGLRFDCFVTENRYMSEYNKIFNPQNIALISSNIDLPPMTTYSIPITSNGDECSICLMQFAPADNVVKLSCNHLFHRTCVTTWFMQKYTCPVCRNSST